MAFLPAAVPSTTTHLSTDTRQQASSKRTSVAVTARLKAASGALSPASTMRSSARALGSAPLSLTSRAQPVVKKASIIMDRGQPCGMPLFLMWPGPTWPGTWIWTCMLSKYPL
eukprot:3017088-Alexandrium_andersonii.AAC.1